MCVCVCVCVCVCDVSVWWVNNESLWEALDSCDSASVAVKEQFIQLWENISELNMRKNYSHLGLHKSTVHLLLLCFVAPE